MLKYVLAACVATAMAADDCSTLLHKVGSCSLGQKLVDLETLTTCKTEICALLDPYAIAHGADMTKKLAGTGYGCIIEDWDGTNVGDVICTPSGGPPPDTPQPPPTPQPPGPTPDTPPPGVPVEPTPAEPSSSSDGVDGGVIFLIIFFVGFAVYMGAGMAYRFKVKGETGVNMVPNVEFWKDLPNLMKDGALFIKNKVTGGGYSSV
eukprot:TRINITY_DN3678_c0_g2_i3.p1 TRINITY_DN3678_c0_g2~~TRINITY_DN3678_c0_g2_i3.p1  ORF type:complete len:206 (+),score=45.74 TRINITY_DN3678_c0_g2_i3:54-671(+)